jgi:hypothetical protein
MTDNEKLQKVEDAISALEDVKEALKEQEDLRVKSFLEDVLGSVFGTEVPYTLRVRLCELFKEYNTKSSGGDEWYGWTFKGEKEYRKVIKEIKLQLGKEE